MSDGSRWFNKILIDKHEYLAKLCALGLAVQQLSELSGKPLEHWMTYLDTHAITPLHLLTPEQVDAAIQQYQEAKKKS
ncbi:hypothetical protein [Cylindrospermum sp. FACHB-282]|uniref:hypothetical protein n=1 Tax=Cylindrospermum sp. FACHB-282 TaxID=2692794 RepID=UPI0016826A20|nr:hypothetical protein [Cylindrospermum sp. FACHB-282]MBD2386930.1 hypothetical protein [Cylindrospermum sp. FACHB-282]